MLISDGVIGLRPIEVADAAAHLAAQDREPRRPAGPGAPNVVTEFEHRAAEWAADGPRRTFAVVELSTHALAGILDIEAEPKFLMKRQADIGYTIYSPWRGSSIAGRTIVLGCRYLARHDMVDEAVLRLDPGNKEAVALAHHLGFHFHRSSTESGGTLDWFVQAV